MSGMGASRESRFVPHGAAMALVGPPRLHVCVRGSCWSCDVTRTPERSQQSSPGGGPCPVLRATVIWPLAPVRTGCPLPPPPGPRGSPTAVTARASLGRQDFALALCSPWLGLGRVLTRWNVLCLPPSRRPQQVLVIASVAPSCRCPLHRL